MQRIPYKGSHIFQVLPLNSLTKRIDQQYNFTEAEEENLDTMIQTLRYSKELLNIQGFGLAAPQVGWNRRLFICGDIRKATMRNILKRIEVIINPIILQKSTEMSVSEEICLSYANKIAYVGRHDEIVVQYANLMGNVKTYKIKGFMAHLFQHEIDHLDGITVEDRTRNIKDLTQTQE